MHTESGAGGRGGQGTLVPRNEHPVLLGEGFLREDKARMEEERVFEEVN